jgi:hypothetical protein
MVNEHKARDYAIHPSVLDGLFQLVFSALYEGGTVEFPAMVPTFVQTLSVYPDEGFVASGSRLQTSCSSTFNGYRGTNSDVVAMIPDNGKVFVRMEGYRSTFVSSSSSAFDQDSSPRPLLSHLKWQPDLAMMTSDQIRSMCERAQSSSAPLMTYLRILSHKHPTMKILQISSASTVSKIPYADVLSMDGVSQWSRYDLAQTTAEMTEDTQKALSSSYKTINFRTLDIRNDVNHRNFQAEYDLVIAPEECIY